MTLRASRRERGFSLIELAVVLMIVGLLLGGLLMPLASQRDLESIRTTEKALNDIRDVLLGFAAANGRLPCPAPTGIASGGTGAGLEATTAVLGTTVTTGPCGCTTATSGIAAAGGVTCDETTPTGSISGVLPWATLGIPETDAWGNRYTYRVNTRFARAAASQTVFGCTPGSNPASAAFALCSTGDIAVLSAASAGTPVASALPVIVVSHGKNGRGAYSPQGTQLAAATAGTDEAENSNGDITFVSNTGIDDQMTWLPSGLLMSRMLAAGKLP
jgi:prepilin-type N-terminal cleavage/methylation domain-containing protein